MKVSKLFLLLSLLALVVPIAIAQDGDVVADGLLNPRNMSIDADGNIWVAEAGIAGPQVDVNDGAYGMSGRISMISPDGTVSPVITGLGSFGEGGTRGVSAVLATEGSIWFALGESTDHSIPFSTALVEVDAETGRVLHFVDLLTLELEADPDGNPNEQSNPTDFAVTEDGTILIANAGCNCLMSWAPMGEVEVVVAWDHETDNPVPTSVEIGPDGDVYVGFLTGFPFPEGGARIERWSGGELVQTYEGLTAVTGLLVTDDGTIYASEFGVFDQGFGPGRVVMVGDDGTITPVLEGLTSPYGLAQGPDGTLYVSTNTTGGPDGQIIAFSG